MDKLLNECYGLIDDLNYQEDSLSKLIMNYKNNISDTNVFYTKLVEYIAKRINFILKNVLYYQYDENQRVITLNYIDMLFSTVINILKNNKNVNLELETFINLFNKERFKKTKNLQQYENIMNVLIENDTLDKSRFNINFVYNKLLELGNIDAIKSLIKNDKLLDFNPYFTYYLSKYDVSLIIDVLYWYMYFQTKKDYKYCNEKLLEVISLQEFRNKKDDYFYETYLYEILKDKKFTDVFVETAIDIILNHHLNYNYIPSESDEPITLDGYIGLAKNELINLVYKNNYLKRGSLNSDSMILKRNLK